VIAMSTASDHTPRRRGPDKRKRTRRHEFEYLQLVLTVQRYREKYSFVKIVEALELPPRLKNVDLETLRRRTNAIEKKFDSREKLVAEICKELFDKERQVRGVPPRNPTSYVFRANFSDKQ
jgi:hypothetical protein